jgi:predicted GH43/DUF377 family glycosyl hydrolase
MKLQRSPLNPIVIPGTYDWRAVAVFNPAVVLADDRFYMLERACSSLTPLKCQVGLLESDDGVQFRHVSNAPVFRPEDLGYPEGTIEDPRVVRIDDRFIMTYVFRPYAAYCSPNGIRVPRYREHPDVPAVMLNNYQSAIAVSDDLRQWDTLAVITPPEIHDRDNVLFPERIGGRYAMLRRPNEYVGEPYGCEAPSIWLSWSEDLKTWDEPVLIAQPEAPWEAQKIGAATPPLRTDEGWLTLYHGVDAGDHYGVGAMLLDLDDPTRVLARTRKPFMEPETYYEKVGLIIPNVIFPSGNVVKDGTVYIYYGCTDTCIALATVGLQELLDHVKAG